MLGQRHLVHRALYWAVTGKDAYGQPTFGSPVVIRCFWADSAGLTMGTDNTLKRKNASVQVDRQLEVGGYLKHIADTVTDGVALATAPSSPLTEKTCLEIQGTNSSTTIRNTRTVRSVNL